LHLVRNAFDHGIELPATRVSRSGTRRKQSLKFKAAQSSNQTIITVSDDGNGINLNKIDAPKQMGFRR
jgi:chemosensory pili system protein ChpA (sensor histidine kinase/response regulator)